MLFTDIGAGTAFAQTPPDATDIGPVSALEDTAVTINTGQSRSALFVVAQTNAGPTSPLHGTIVPGPNVNGNYTINYTPGPNRVDSVTFDYHFCTTAQPRSCGLAGTVTVNISPVNDGPTATTDAATTNEDTAASIDVLANDSAGPADENQSLTIVDLSSPTTQGGSAVIAAGKVTYTPVADFCGTDTFTYRAQDSGGLKSAVTTVTVTVTCVNDKPKANTDTATVNEDSTSNVIDVLVNDNTGPANESGQLLSLIDIPTAPTNGTAVINSGKIEYTPAPDFCGDDSLEYQIEDDTSVDGTAKKDKGLVEITVTCVTDKPVLSIQNLSPVVDHMFTADIILTSPDADVSSLDFYLGYNCPLAPEVQANSTPPAGMFFFDTQDDATNMRLHIVTASTTNPASILAGPNGSSTERRIGTVKFTLDPSCISNVNNGNASIVLKLNPAGVSAPQFGGTDANPVPGGGLVKNLSATVTGNAKSSDIQLSGNAVPEGVAGAFVGFLTSTDSDTGDTHTYELLAEPNGSACPGNTDDLNGKFVIPTNADYLKLKSGKSLTSGETTTVCIRSTDNFGGALTKQFTIIVTNVNQPPQAVNDNVSGNPIITGPTIIDVLANDNDPDGLGTITIQSVTQGTYGKVVNNGTDVTYTPTDPKRRGNDTFSYTIRDDGGLTDSANVTVKIQPTIQPGDCSGNGIIDAADFTALGLEIFDNDGANWYDTRVDVPFNGDPYGCNSNQDMTIEVSDITCTGIIIFGGTCNNTLLAASTIATASLTVGSDLVSTPGATVDVPVLLTTAGHSVAAAAFAVDFDATALRFDSTDSDGDSIPDAVQLNVPANFIRSVSYNEEKSRVDIFVTGLPPYTLLGDGALATIKFVVNQDTTSETAITLTNSSLGNDQAQSVPVDVTDGAVQVTTVNGLDASTIFLPSIQR